MSVWLTIEYVPHRHPGAEYAFAAFTARIRSTGRGRDPTQRTNQCNDQSSHGTDHSHAHHRREAKTRLLQQPADRGRDNRAQYADRGFKYGRSPTLHIVGRLAVEKAEQTGVQRGERQAGQNLADQDGRLALHEQQRHLADNEQHKRVRNQHTGGNDVDQLVG